MLLSVKALYDRNMFVGLDFIGPREVCGKLYPQLCGFLCGDGEHIEIETFSCRPTVWRIYTSISLSPVSKACHIDV